MKDLIQPFLDLIKQLVQPEKGTKFLVAIAAMGALYLTHAKGFATISSDAGFVLLAAIYFVADIYHKKGKNGGSQ